MVTHACYQHAITALATTIQCLADQALFETQTEKEEFIARISYSFRQTKLALQKAPTKETA